MSGLIFGFIGCAGTVITGCVAGRAAFRRRRKQQHESQVMREFVNQLGANAEWARSAYRRQSHGEEP